MAGALKFWNGEEDIVIGGSGGGALGPEAVKTGNIAAQAVTTAKLADGAVTKEKLDPNLQLDSNDVYIGTEQPTGENLPKLWVNPDDTRLPLTMSKIWENPNVAGEFAPQTVALDLSEYDFVAVEMISYASSSEVKTCKTFFSRIGTKTVAYLQMYYLRYRSYTVTTTGIIFEEGIVGNASFAESTNNMACVPYRIYGIKGVN